MIEPFRNSCPPRRAHRAVATRASRGGRSRVANVLVVGASALSALGLSVATLSGCGGSPAYGGASGPKDSSPGAELATLEDAEGALAAAESQLKSFGVGSASGGDAAAPPVATALPSAGHPTAAPLAESPGDGQDRCVTACDALGSMKRAADRVCVLAPGERCEAATARVTTAEKRVFDACPGCSA